MYSSKSYKLQQALVNNSEQSGGEAREYRDETTGMEFVLVLGGFFHMGDVFGRKKKNTWFPIYGALCCGADNHGIMQHSLPVQLVAVKSFYLAKYAVTQGEWEKIMGHNPSFFQKSSRHLVDWVTWHDVQMFISRLNAESGRKYRLPSEAEWEYAARESGKKVRFGTGRDTISTDEANYDGSYSDDYSVEGEYRGETLPVDSFQPNSLGLYNMSGNVREWCQDIWHDNYQGMPKDGTAWETAGDSSRRVVRGGCWCADPLRLSTVCREHRKAGNKYYCLGFRLAFSA